MAGRMTASTGVDRWVSDPRAAAADARRVAARLRRRDRTVTDRWLATRAALEAAETNAAHAVAAAHQRVRVAMEPYTPLTYRRAAATRHADWWRLSGADDPHAFAVTRRKVESAQRQAVRETDRAARVVDAARVRYEAATSALLAALPSAAPLLGRSARAASAAMRIPPDAGFLG